MKYDQAIDFTTEMLLGQLSAAAKSKKSLHEVLRVGLLAAYQAGLVDSSSEPPSGPETVRPAAPVIEAWLLLTCFGHEFFLQRSAAVERALALSGSGPILPLYHLTTKTIEQNSEPKEGLE